MFNPEFWELASFVATTIGLPIAAIGLFYIAWQTHIQKMQARRDVLLALYVEFDTHDARLARSFIYNAPQDALRLDSLKRNPSHLKIVDDTLAGLERMVYPIVKGYLPNNDAFDLYGGVLLAISKRLWPYIDDQRTMREASSVSHSLVYRRFLDDAIRMWAPTYARAINLKPLKLKGVSTGTILEQLFPEDANTE
jgi:hypothetical protein